ncbi:MAG TPA: hypothetical protein VN765_03065, partial [Candidatus Acidoferrum sp.]|nr:hypothetical protein [Candidatus Acidoferrum sp.]
MKKSIKIILTFLCSCAWAAQDQPIVIIRTNDATRLIPVSISGFSGEADAVLKFDLSVLGLQVTTPDKAEYLISGTQNSGLEGRLQPAGSSGASGDAFAHTYNGGNTRSQAHSFADDIVK